MLMFLAHCFEWNDPSIYARLGRNYASTGNARQGQPWLSAWYKNFNDMILPLKQETMTEWINYHLIVKSKCQLLRMNTCSNFFDIPLTPVVNTPKPWEKLTQQNIKNIPSS